MAEGATHRMVAAPGPATATTEAGAAGGPTGTTGTDAVDTSEVPARFEALTTNV